MEPNNFNPQNQNFNQNPVPQNFTPPPVTPVATSAGMSLTIKILMVVVGLVVIGGAGLYFTSSKNNPSVLDNRQNTPINNQNQIASSKVAPFTCANVFSESDFQKVFKDPRPVKTQDNAEAKASYVNSGYSEGFGCTYFQGEMYADNLLNVIVIWPGDAFNAPSVDSMHEEIKKLMQANYQAAMSAGDGEGEPPKDITGVGSKAFTFVNGVYAVNSNKKYWFGVIDFGSFFDFTLVVEAGKLVNTNLNKY